MPSSLSTQMRPPWASTRHLAEGQPQPRTHLATRLAGFDLPELLEDAPERFLGNAFAGIADVEDHFVVLDPRADGHGAPIRA